MVTTQYTLTSVSSSACCIGTGNSGTPTIVVSPTTVAPINVTALPSGAVCLGDGVLMTVTNGIPITPLNFTQTTGLTVQAVNLIGCGSGNPRTHTDNSYWRVYNLAPLARLFQAPTPRTCSCHWYVNGPVPVAVTLKLALVLSQFVTLIG